MGLINYLMELPLLTQAVIAVCIMLELLLLYQAVRMYRVARRYRYAMLNRPYPELALIGWIQRVQSSRLNKVAYTMLSFPVGLLFGNRDFNRYQLTALYAFIGLVGLSVYFFTQLNVIR